jgi:urease accessory protein
MHLVTQALSGFPEGLNVVKVEVDRHKLSRRRWRGTANDGSDFGFDVNEALSHGDCIHVTDTEIYMIEQRVEDCFLVPIKEAKKAAWVGWMIGNLHFKAAFTEEGILVQDDLAVQQMLEREYIHYHRVKQIFQPAKQGGHSHDHHHSH